MHENKIYEWSQNVFPSGGKELLSLTDNQFVMLMNNGSMNLFELSVTSKFNVNMR